MGQTGDRQMNTVMLFKCNGVMSTDEEYKGRQYLITKCLNVHHVLCTDLSAHGDDRSVLELGPFFYLQRDAREVALSCILPCAHQLNLQIHMGITNPAKQPKFCSRERCTQQRKDTGSGGQAKGEGWFGRPCCV